MKILVGLGNPGGKYEKTYHNMGFFVVDKFAEKLGVNISRWKWNCLVGKTTIGGEDVLFVKPQTYMNLSGDAVRLLKRKYKLNNQDIFVVVDDIDLPVGAYRFKMGGSGGTHNGMRDIVAKIGADFPRFRIGVGGPKEGEALVDFVLKRIPKEQLEVFDEVADEAIEFLTEKLGEGNV